MKTAVAAVVAACVCGPSADAFAAGAQCAEHTQLVGLLAKKYSEDPIVMGSVNDERYMQLFVSPTGSWTILVTQTDGLACILAAGQNLEKAPRIAKVGPAA